jgi:hypothetical protein
MVLVIGQEELLLVLVLIVKLCVAALPERGLVASFETAGFDCVEIALLLSSARVVSVDALGCRPEVLPVLVFVGPVVPVPVPVDVPVPVPVPVPVLLVQLTDT